MADSNALQQSWKGLQDALKWLSPEPLSPLPSNDKQTLAEPGGIKQAVNNVVAAATFRPQLIRPFSQEGLGTSVVHTAKDLINRIIPNQSFGKTPVGFAPQPMKPSAGTNLTVPYPTVPSGAMSERPQSVISLQDLLTNAQKILGTQVTPTSVPTATPTPSTIPSPTPINLTGRNPAITNYSIAPVVQSALTQAANTFNLPPSILYDIAMQESSFNPNLINNTSEGRKAGHPTGLFQFTDNTWRTVLRYANMPNSSLHLPNTNRLDPLTNALAAAYLISHGQLGRWDASKNVWGPYYKPEELQPYYLQTLGREK